MADDEKPLKRITDLTDAELDTSALAEAWKSVESTLLNQEITSVIGYVAVFWSVVEHVLYLLLRRIHLMDDTSMLLIIDMPFLQRLSAVTASLSLSGNEDLFHEWCDIEKELNAVRIRRNDIIHGWWSTKETEHFLARITAKGKFKLGTSKYETRDVQKIVVSILKVIRRTKDFYEKLEKIDVKELMKTSTRTLDRTRSPKARAQVQARAQKRARQTPPQRLKPNGVKLSSAQKRALREAENQEKGDEP